MCISVRAWIVSAMTMFASAAPAVAGQAMAFKPTGLFQVLAEGQITPDTPAAFTDYLNRNGPVHLTLMFNSSGTLLAAPCCLQFCAVLSEVGLYDSGLQIGR